MSFLDLIIKDGTALVSKDFDSTELIEDRVDIGIKDGVIQEIGSISTSRAQKIFSAKNLHILPGLMDLQVHFREPGMEHKENFETGSKSALIGGITGVFEMPNTSPPTTNKEAFQDKLNRAKDRFYCDYAFFVGASPENKNELAQLELQKGCCGVKVFMGSSTGNLLLDKEEDLECIVKNGTRRMAAHCEDEKRLVERKKYIEPNNVLTHPIWRDEQTAFLATERLLKLARKYSRKVHVLHVTTKQEMELLSKYKDVATVEVTPQHLTLTSPECYERWNSLAQMNPPIRTKDHQEALWKGIHNNIVDVIGSDHAPHTMDEKNKPYPHSPSGLPGVQTILPLLLHHRSQHRLDLKTIVRFLAIHPQKIFNIKNRGRITPGAIANFTILDLKREFTIDQNWLTSKAGWSPFEGMKITGFPFAVLMRGQVAMQEAEVLLPPLGKTIDFN